MNENVRDVVMALLGAVFAKAVDVIWDRLEGRKRRTPRRPGKESKES